jgi:hypothetical protein
LACVLMAFAMLAFLIIEWPAGESQRVTSKPGATLPARGLRHA